MKQLLKVTDHPNLFRDPHTKAIIVMDSAARTNYNNQKAIAKKTIETGNELRDEVSQLKSEIGEIKALLLKLVDK